MPVSTDMAIEAESSPAGVSRWVDPRGRISVAGVLLLRRATFAGEPVEVVATGGLVEILHAGVLVATHVQRVKADHKDRAIITTRRVLQQRHARRRRPGWP
jgi:hypothetical protein